MHPFARVSIALLVGALAAAQGGCSDGKASASTPVKARAEREADLAAANAAQEWRVGPAVAGAESVKLGELAARAGELGERMVRVEGTVTGVCQSRGCWIELSDGTSKLIAKSIDHSIVFPRDAVGRRMIIEGAVKLGATPSCNGGAEMHAEGEAHSCPQPEILVDAKSAVLLPQS